MTSSAEPVRPHPAGAATPDCLGDFLAATLAGVRPASESEAQGTCAYGAVRWQWLDEGVLQLEPVHTGGVRGEPLKSVLLSAGVHGDETAPIELLSRMVTDLAAGHLALACRLLVVLGNVAAMRAGTRYEDDDLNRLFSGRHARVPQSREAPRAVALETAAQRFFAEASEVPGVRWHLDLHTAIRASAFEQFALLPYTGDAPTRAMFDWLADANIAAVLIHTEKGVTYSAFTADACGAVACTLELGKVRPFGQNDLTRFAQADAAVRRLVSGAQAAEDAPMPRVFTVIGQITKQSDAFALHVAADVANFTPFARGTVLAEDGAYRYVVARDEERIVFPNPTVKPGLRAGLLVVDTTAETLASLT
ncbi:Succinylglutamate desuccinylase [Paraburkholderia caffeinitolerans]|uniref:Succinylglutamate desuccinylase n=1 Tax=Paraburkholderia caffeinitolerans TaxID=1723730 RepID=A0A6J5FF36_9BURK|nr:MULTISPECIES: succinylglutamate desuccinylase [Paraburkholderia]CAB3778935.1 Succinylglutamate desuccinylase [Paraburkholderia caffeinitolerans]